MNKVKSVEEKIDTRSIMPPPTSCRFCHSGIRYTSHAEIYGGRTYSDWPYIYLCINPKCRASVGVHAGTTHPLGTLADKDTKDARKAAHAAFDPLWKREANKGKARGMAYKWLAEQLDIEPWRCHISWMDTDLCRKVVKICLQRAMSGAH